MTSDFDVLSGCLGSGDPAPSAIWFVGLEGAAPSTPEEVERCRGAGWYLPVGPGELRDAREKYGRGFTKTYPIMAKLVVRARLPGIGSNFGPDQHREYMDRELFLPGSRVFQANLYPLGKRAYGADIPDETRRMLGLGQLSLAQYRARVAETRFPALRSRWAECRPQVTVCFGSGAAQQFASALGLAPGVTDGAFTVHEEARVLLTPFFNDRFMTDAHVNRLATLMRRVASGASAS